MDERSHGRYNGKMGSLEKDKYQKRYEVHQDRKREMMLKIMESRHSDRMFGDEPLPNESVRLFEEVLGMCPTSCNRGAIFIRDIDNRDDKALLGGLLVGGVGWVHRADRIFLLFADDNAYKAPGEKEYMPFLDAGVVVEQFYLLSEVLDISCCFVNPNIREQNKEFFQQRFGDKIFCGAFAIGSRYEK